MENVCAVILAGGRGQRMMSDMPKVMMEVAFEPMISWVISSCRLSGVKDICVVTGYKHEVVEEYLAKNFSTVSTAFQPEQLGTGHAVQCAMKYLESTPAKDVLVLCGDAPFISNDTIRQAHKLHVGAENSATVISAVVPDPTGYGRIIRSGGGIMTGIVEHKDAAWEQLSVKEVSSGAFWFNKSDLIMMLGVISNINEGGEYYLPDTVKLLLNSGKPAGAYTAENPDAVLGANDRKGLWGLCEIAKKNIIDMHFYNGVEFVSVDGVILSPKVTIGAGTKILPGTIIKGACKIGSHCVIGPGAFIEDSTIGDDSVINASQIYSSDIGSGVKIGPFSHIRPNSHIADGVKIGDFVEVKNSHIDKGTSVAHLTYIGDSDVGKSVNFGCGCVTVNYDGKKKARCNICDNAFIGCNTNLIAPVTVGENAYTAAGSTITQNVPAGALAIARSRQENKNGYAKKKWR
ncbi:MAG: bifunctional UDP-N-acetylglucosamine diphosphorylase/glucosamine-1-phosphate N-acetyltransferase GlmU [Oscillospiraceae bacterium]|nr:bifunctional UDP-N-acetylglucosamine diphosphorylase/glucosamine-1-phosphate N-acetyltransferase GlmU [Oscillospiraceae bacterium]